jgi:hypothetical protein
MNKMTEVKKNQQTIIIEHPIHVYKFRIVL